MKPFRSRFACILSINAAVIAGVGLLPVAAALADTSSTSTMPPPPPGGHGHHMGPPPEAIEACSGKSAQMSCSFADRNGNSHSGICELDSGPPGGGRGGPQDSSETSSTPNTDATNSILACRDPNMGKGGPPPQ